MAIQLKPKAKWTLYFYLRFIGSQMLRIPVEKYKLQGLEDDDVISAWKWFLSFISEGDWKRRKANIEKKISVEFKASPPSLEGLSEVTVLAVKDDLIGWYLYLVDMIINEPHKYEFFQGARVLPIFKRFGTDLDRLKKIEGVEKRIKDLMRKRQSEADAILFEILTALLWARNGYEITFVDEKNEKTPDIIAKKEGRTWSIECKRQSKTADYTYRETAKRRKMISYISFELLKQNILLDIVFHVELETLPDSFLKDLLERTFTQRVNPGRIVSNGQVDIDLAFVDMPAIKQHLENNSVKYGSPLLNTLIGKKQIDGKGFTCGLYANLFRVGEGNVNNLFMSDISNAYGVHWSCDAKEAVWAKARDIKSQVHAAIQQFNSEDTAIIHVGMETFDGPDVEMKRLGKIKDTIEKIDLARTNLSWIFCHFFQAYSPPDQCWIFDETVSSFSPHLGIPPLLKRLMIVPEDGDNAEGIAHWDRPLP